MIYTILYNLVHLANTDGCVIVAMLMVADLPGVAACP